MPNQTEKHIRIAVTGPESTGKTTLAMQLADEFDGLYVPEFARSYVENLNRQYVYSDVEAIARAQVNQYTEAIRSKKIVQFFDTWLIITKVWFRWVYNQIPDWLENEIQKYPMDLYLLCRPDLPWEDDPVRENGGENRIRLYEEYRQELINHGCRYVEIGGAGDQRLENAIKAIRHFYQLS
jgi:NadR type nicotinamide-nucleotide adenylyltransferase